MRARIGMMLVLIAAGGCRSGASWNDPFGGADRVPPPASRIGGDPIPTLPPGTPVQSAPAWSGAPPANAWPSTTAPVTTAPTWSTTPSAPATSTWPSTPTNSWPAAPTVSPGMGQAFPQTPAQMPPAPANYPQTPSTYSPAPNYSSPPVNYGASLPPQGIPLDAQPASYQQPTGTNLPWIAQSAPVRPSTGYESAPRVRLPEPNGLATQGYAAATAFQPVTPSATQPMGPIEAAVVAGGSAEDGFRPRGATRTANASAPGAW